MATARQTQPAHQGCRLTFLLKGCWINKMLGEEKLLRALNRPWIWLVNTKMLMSGWNGQKTFRGCILLDMTLHLVSWKFLLYAILRFTVSCYVVMFNPVKLLHLFLYARQKHNGFVGVLLYGLVRDLANLRVCCAVEYLRLTNPLFFSQSQAFVHDWARQNVNSGSTRLIENQEHLLQLHNYSLWKGNFDKSNTSLSLKERSSRPLWTSRKHKLKYGFRTAEQKQRGFMKPNWKNLNWRASHICRQDFRRTLDLALCVANLRLMVRTSLFSPMRT